MKQTLSVRNFFDNSSGDGSSGAFCGERFTEEKGFGEPVDDITASDIDLDKVYDLIDHSSCRVGANYLYSLLRRPVWKEEILRRRDAAVNAFTEDGAAMAKCSESLSAIGNRWKYDLSDYMGTLDKADADSNAIHLFCMALAFLAIVLIFVLPAAGFFAIIAVSVINLVLYFRRMSKIEPYCSTFSYLVRMIRNIPSLSRALPDSLSEYREKLLSLHSRLSPIAAGYFLLSSGHDLTGSILDLPLDYIRLFFHADLIKFNQMLTASRERMEDIEELYCLTGFLDSMISISIFRKDLKTWCRPSFSQEGNCYEASGLIHPLIGRCVSSDLTARRGVLITGSNASGKSTFLKSVALSVLMGQTICTVTADSLKISHFSICSSMSLEDSVIRGESYYMAEIRALKRMIDKLSGSPAGRRTPLLCLLDEALRGTNTIERIASASCIMKGLSDRGALCFAATHDAELVDILKNDYDSYYFPESFQNGQLRFPYTLTPGRSRSTDAIALLTVIGFEKQLTDRAKDLSVHFQEKGEWKSL